MPTLKTKWAEIPLTQLGVRAISALVVIACAMAIGQYFVVPWLKLEPAMDEHLAAQIEWANRHLFEVPVIESTIIDTELERVIARWYASDDSIGIARIPKAGGYQPIVVPVWSPRSVTAPPTYSDQDSGGTLTTPAYAGGCGAGRCIHDPRDQNFRWWRDKPDANGWYRLWREWRDGCSHYQTCHVSGPCASNQDGTPKIVWRCCNH